MKKLVHNLRNKPEHVRLRILYISIIFFTVVMVGIWIYTLRANQTTSASLKKDLEPFTMLKSSIIDSAKDISWPIKN